MYFITKLDLELFEQKFKLLKEDSVDLKGALKRLETKNYEKIFNKRSKPLTTRVELQNKETSEGLKNNLELLSSSAPRYRELTRYQRIIDITNITKQIRHKENQVTSLQLKVGEDEDTLKIKQGL